MFTNAVILAVLASIAAAQRHAPVGEPSGNAITRPVNEIVPACQPFTITWTPSTPNTVSVLLLKGPSTNVVKFGPSLAEGIANSGTLMWTPSADLEATTGSTGYGIQIIDDVTGQYQYSTQFGIRKDACSAPSSAAPVPSATASPVAPVASKEGYPAASPVGPMESYPVASSSAHPSASKPAVHNPTAPVAPYPTKPAGTGAPNGNGTVIQPTGSLTVPSSLRPIASGTPGNATTTRLPEATGAASALQAGLGLAGAAVAFAFML